VKIPSDAIISRAKLTQYLLVWRRKKDKSKFLARAGFTINNPDDLELAIRQLIAENEAFEDGRNQFGDYYRVEGRLTGPNGITLAVITIWIIRAYSDGKFHFVGLVPGRKVKS
jgi:hypothetical protein